MRALSQKLLLFMIVLMMSGGVRAEDRVSRSTIEKWIGQLSAETLSQRETAADQLAEAGRTAVPALAKVALSGKPNVVAEAIDILADITTESAEEETRKAATIVLEMLAESSDTSTARRAEQTLESVEEVSPRTLSGWDKPDSDWTAEPDGLGSGADQSVSVSNVNGVKIITVKESGKTTTLQDLPSGAVRVRIDGDGRPKEFVAKNLNQLKRKDPAVYALYERHGGRDQGVNVFNERGGARAGAFANGTAGSRAFGGNAFGSIPLGNKTFGNSGYGKPGYGNTPFSNGAFINGTFQNGGSGSGGYARGSFSGGAFVTGGSSSSSQQSASSQPMSSNLTNSSAASGRDAKQMMIQQLTELKGRMSGNSQMQQLLDQQIKDLRP